MLEPPLKEWLSSTSSRGPELEANRRSGHRHGELRRSLPQALERADSGLHHSSTAQERPTSAATQAAIFASPSPASTTASGRADRREHGELHAERPAGVSCAQPVADTPHGLEQARAGRIALRFSRRRRMCTVTSSAGAERGRVAPDAVQSLIAREDAVRLDARNHKSSNSRAVSWRTARRRAALHSSRVDREHPTATERARRALGRSLRRTVRTRVARGENGFVTAPSSRPTMRSDSSPRAVARITGHSEVDGVQRQSASPSVSARKRRVEQDEIPAARASIFARALVGRDDAMAIVLEVPGDDVEDDALIVDREKPRRPRAPLRLRVT